MCGGMRLDTCVLPASVLYDWPTGQSRWHAPSRFVHVISSVPRLLKFTSIYENKGSGRLNSPSGTKPNCRYGWRMPALNVLQDGPEMKRFALDHIHVVGSAI